MREVFSMFVRVPDLISYINLAGFLKCHQKCSSFKMRYQYEDQVEQYRKNIEINVNAGKEILT